MSPLELIPNSIRDLYEIREWHHAASILAVDFPEEFKDICQALGSFRFSIRQIREAGGRESQIPKTFSEILRPLGWKESQLHAKLTVDDKEVSSDTHKVDYLKNRIAFDLEWNSKDQTFDRDLFAFRTFFDYGKISVGVLVTRSNELDPFFKSVGLYQKYGASTTQMGKLLPRLEAGRGGGCPILVFGITTKLMTRSQDGI